jgi:hypothetical protein
LSARQVSAYRACPPLASDIESTRGDLLAKMRVFAQQTNDRVFNDYLTVAMAPLGTGNCPRILTDGGDVGESLESPTSICDPKHADVA